MSFVEQLPLLSPNGDDGAPIAHTRKVSITVSGTPVPEGSLRSFALPNGKVVTRHSDRTYEWREAVRAAVVAHRVARFEGAVDVRLGFELPRPGHHFLPVNSRRAVPELRAVAPRWPTGPPDLDKLCRSILDSCTDAELWNDDAQVIVLLAAKRYGTTPGVKITVTDARDA